MKTDIEDPPKVMTRQDLLKACENAVDNTGNVKIWPSEITLANFLLKNSYLFEEKRVCELGAGKSGMAAIALAIKLKDKIGKIMISDGNEECWESIKRNLQLNKDAIGEENLSRISVKCIVWDENLKLSENKYDYIWIADCLFFRKYHRALEHTLSELLEDSDEEGRVFIMGPNRSNTLWEFIDEVDQNEIFDHTVEKVQEMTQVEQHISGEEDMEVDRYFEDQDDDEVQLDLPQEDEEENTGLPALDSEEGSPSPDNE